MMPMRVFRALFFGALALAQTPPPDVDQALRARVAQFFQAHVDGKWRDALALVAEDSKDQFLERGKQRILGFAVEKITWSDEFRQAEVLVFVEGDSLIPGIGPVKGKRPVTTAWKLVDGQWFWVSEPKEEQTPFGTLKPGAGTPAPLPEAKPGLPPGASPAVVLANRSALGVDKDRIELKAAERSSAAVVVNNPLNGWVKLETGLPEVPGLTARLEKEDIPPQSTGKVIFEYTPDGNAPARQVRAVIVVQPFRRVFPVYITFARPAADTAAAAPLAKTPVKKAPKK